MNFEEALLTVALYAFSLSACALPFVITYFTVMFHKRERHLKRSTATLDDAIGIIIESEKYNNGKEERSGGDTD